MADFSNIKQEINDVIYDNEKGGITSKNLRELEIKIVDSIDGLKLDVISDLSEIRQKANNAITSEEQNLTDQQRNQALANVSNQTADSNTGKMGYKVLQSDATFASQVSQQNTVYEIRDVFDLNNQSVTIPANCVLKFEGGVLKNGTIVGNNTSFSGSNVKGIDSTTNLSGTFIGELNACWIGAKHGALSSSFDNSVVLQKFFDSYSNYIKTLSFPTGEFTFKTSVVFNKKIDNITIEGNNSVFNVYITTDDSTFISLEEGVSGGAHVNPGERLSINNIRFKNIYKQFEMKENGQYVDPYDEGQTWRYISKTNCLSIAKGQGFCIYNCEFWYFNIAITIQNCYYGIFDGYNAVKYCRVGIVLEGGLDGYYEVNGIDIHNVEFKPTSIYLSECLFERQDESDDEYKMKIARVGIDSYVFTNGTKIYGCIIEKFDYGIRFNYRESDISSSKTYASGIIIIDSCYFELNKQYDIYVGKGNCFATYIYKMFQMCAIKNCRFYSNGNGSNKSFVCCTKVIAEGNQTFNLIVNDKDGEIGTTAYYRTSIITDGSASSSWPYMIGKGLPYADYGTNGSFSTITRHYQAVKQLNNASYLYIGLNGLRNTDAELNNYIEQGTTLKLPNRYSFNVTPVYDSQLDIMPFGLFSRRDTIKAKIPSSNKISNFNVDYSYASRLVSTRGINIRDFLAKWNNGENYSGYVSHLNAKQIISYKSAGKIQDSSGRNIGFDKTCNISTLDTNGYYIFLDGLIVLYLDSSRNCIFFADIVNDYITKTESLPSNSTAEAIAQKRVIGTAAQKEYVRKSLNAIYYDTDNDSLQIFNGYSWVDLTDPFKRYYFVDNGKSISLRMEEGEYNGQTFFNAATGITYTFSLSPDRTSFAWIPSIGYVTSLEHPNYYDTTDNPLDYATELSVGEMVMYNGSIIKWDGTGFVNLDGSTLS